MLCWMNGQYIEDTELKISPFDHGFLYGLGFFETFRTYNGKPAFLQEHLERLHGALATYRIDFPYSLDEVAKVVAQLNDVAEDEDGYFRVNVSAGVHDIGLAPSEYKAPTIIIFRKKLPPSTRGKEKDAVILKIARNEPESGKRYKGHHYGNNVLARMELPSLAAHEGIFLTAAGCVAEGITSNVFWVKNDIIYTPSLDAGILPGITRGWLINYLRQQGYALEEGLFPAEQLLHADECFITNAVQELVPIKQLESVKLLGEAGPVYAKLHTTYIEELQRRVQG